MKRQMAQWERQERRERIELCVWTAVAVIGGGVVLLRTSPAAVVKVVGPSQLGRGLRACRS